MKKVIITALLVLVALTGQSQTVKGLPDRVLNHKMDMTAPLPEPSFEMYTTTVRVHALGRTETFYNVIPSYGLFHAIYRLNKQQKNKK